MAAASVLLAIGLVAPMLTISKFIVIRSSFSVFSGVLELFKNKQYILFVVVTGFSLILPIFKIGLLFKAVGKKAKTGETAQRYLRLMHEYGRWAMLDVLVVAVLVVTVKLGAVVSIKIHWGLYVFGAAVLLLMLITKRVVRLLGG